MTIDNGVLYVSVPEGYDGSTPLPIVLGFGAYGGQMLDILTSAELPTTSSALARDYVIVRARASQAPNSTWEGLGVDAFDEVYQAVEASVCFDKARVFGVGNEGGGRFLTKHVCEDAPDGKVGPEHLPSARSCRVSDSSLRWLAGASSSFPPQYRNGRGRG